MLAVSILYKFKGFSVRHKISIVLLFIKYILSFNGILEPLMIRLIKGIYKKRNFKKKIYGQ